MKKYKKRCRGCPKYFQSKGTYSVYCPDCVKKKNYKQIEFFDGTRY